MMNVDSMNVDLKELVKFMDVTPEVRRHSSAIKGLACEELNLALLCHFLETQYGEVTILGSSCTGITKGSRLDAWVKCSTPISPLDIDLLYQVEVKSWSFHGYNGGKPLPLNLSYEAYKVHVIARWSKYWNDGSRKFNDPKLNKVLNEMNVPKEFECQKDNIRTLACLWDAIHPKGEKEAFFEIECFPGKFKAVSIFSVSTYVRNLIENNTCSLVLNLPDTKQLLTPTEN